jgi:hypothetical protein
MLINQPVVKVFADNAAVLLLLDTGSEATVLTPAAAQRIGAQYPRDLILAERLPCRLRSARRIAQVQRIFTGSRRLYQRL